MSEIENLKIGNGGMLHIVGNEDIIANEWEAGQVYIENRSYVIREHKLLMCNTTHTSVEPFDPDKWTEKNIGEALGTAGSANMIECTLAEYTAWKAGGQLINETVYVITDAPNLNATAQEISYDGGADTVWDKVEEKANEHTIENVSLACPRCPISSLSNTTAYGSGKIYYYASKIEFGATGESTFAYLTCSLFANVDYVMGYMYDNDNDRYYSIGKGNSTSLWVFSASANRTPANTFAGKQNIYINLIGIKL